MSFLFRSTRNRKKEQEDLDRGYYERQKAFNQAKQEQRIQNAKAAGIAAANREANKKPFFAKVVGVASAIGKDLATGDPNDMLPFQNRKGQSNPFFNFDEEQKPKRKRRKKKHQPK